MVYIFLAIYYSVFQKMIFYLTLEGQIILYAFNIIKSKDKNTIFVAIIFLKHFYHFF